MRLAAVGIAAAFRLAEQFPVAETAVVESAAVGVAAVGIAAVGIAVAEFLVAEFLVAVARIVAVAEQVCAGVERIPVGALSVAECLALELFGCWFAERSSYSAGLSSMEVVVERSDCFLEP